VNELVPSAQPTLTDRESDAVITRYTTASHGSLGRRPTQPCVCP